MLPVFSRKVHGNVQQTSIPCKIFEHIIYSTVYKHLEINSILSDGFRKNRSCEMQLIAKIHDIASRLNAGDQIDVFFWISLRLSTSLRCLMIGWSTN